MFNNLKIALLTSLMIPGVAFAEINVGEELGVSHSSIIATLETRGYTLLETEVEGDEIEIEAMLGDEVFEVEVSADTGTVLAVYLEDEDENDDDKEDENDD